MNKCRVGKRHKNSRLWAVALGLLALAVLCVSAAAQENTTDYWMDRANVLIHKDLEEEAVFAYDEVLKLDPKNETALLRKASTLYTLGKETEGQRAYERALLLIEEDLKNISQNAKAWQNKASATSALRTRAPGSTTTSSMSTDSSTTAPCTFTPGESTERVI